MNQLRSQSTTPLQAPGSDHADVVPAEPALTESVSTESARAEPAPVKRRLSVLAAAGSGTRLGRHMPKALVEVGGAPMVLRALRGLDAAGITHIAVTAPTDALVDFEQLIGSALPDLSATVRVVAGGASRQASVAAGLRSLEQFRPDARTPVLIHDAARCLTPPALIDRVARAIENGANAVIPTLPVTDTIKPLATGTHIDEGDDALSPLDPSIDRSRLRAVQTPQGFTWDVICRAHEYGASRAADESSAATDDAGLVEALGLTVMSIAGDTMAFKVTTELDIALAQACLDHRYAPDA